MLQFLGKGDTTLSLMTLNIMTFSKMTLRIKDSIILIISGTKNK
jgi:hypothetical protein